MAAEVDHDGDLAFAAGFDGFVDRMPVRSAVVGHFDADDIFRKFFYPCSRPLAVHVEGVLFVVAAAHARADDVHEGQYAGLRMIDDALFEYRELPPSRTTGVDYCSSAGPEAKAIRHHAFFAAGVFAVGIFTVGGGCLLTGDGEEDMSMDIDEAGRDPCAAYVDGRCGLAGVYPFGDPGDPAIVDGDVHGIVPVVRRVDEVAVFDEQAKGLYAGGRCDDE